MQGCSGRRAIAVAAPAHPAGAAIPRRL